MNLEQTSANRSSTEPPLVAAQSIGRQVASRGWLLREINIDIIGGARIGLVGPTGAGKTLLLRSLALLDPLEAGSITWRGSRIPAKLIPKYRSQVMYLHQRPAIATGTVETNLKLPFKLQIHQGKAFDRDKVTSWFHRFGRPAGFLAHDHRNLSGGERQLVALIRAMQFDPAVLLLDEPTAALDVPTAIAVEQFVTSWVVERPAERAFVWVSHDREQVRRVSDQVVEIVDGRLASTKVINV